MTRRAVVIGGGHAAAQFVVSLRMEGWEDEILMIGDEPSVPYQRPPLSKGYLNGEVPADKMLIRPAEFYPTRQIDMRMAERAIKIDRDNKQVHLSNGDQVTYDGLCLATGTRARRLDQVEGADLAGIHYLRTMADIDRISDDLASAKKAVIVGGGYIGLETAASLRKRGIEVTVVEAAERILQRVTAPAMSAFFARVHREEGVVLLEGTGLDAFVGDQGRVRGIRTNDGQVLDADIVIVGIGVMVNDDLAVEAGLKVENGIVVNEYCQTDDPDIVAIGDCTFHHNRHYDRFVRLESVPNANEQAKIAAKTLTGKQVAYDSLPWFWSDQYDIKLQIAGLSQGYDQIHVQGDLNSRSFCLYYSLDGELLAADAVNSPREFMLAKKTILNRGGVPDEAVSL